MKHAIPIAVIAALSTFGCAKPRPPSEVALNPCMPMVATVQLQCFYGGAARPMSQCKAVQEAPVGCNIGPAAEQFFNSGLDMSVAFRDDPDRPKWVQFTVTRDATGKVGQPLWPNDGGPPFLKNERRFEEGAN